MLTPAQIARIEAERLWQPVLPPGEDTKAQAPDLTILPPIRWVCPWRGDVLTPDEGLEALSFLASAARLNDRPAHLVGMSRWKRRCVAPFLAGPHGPPTHGRMGAPIPPGARAIYWGDHTRIAGVPEGAIGVEDGFIRSVGLGLRHVPPVSLIFSAGAQYFDATPPSAWRNGFEDVAATITFPPALLTRAAKLRARIIEAGLSKYNLSHHAHDLPPKPHGQEAVLVIGQVESDASIRLGGADITRNIDLLRTARALFPDAVIAYKPHPDVLTGLRDGGEDPANHADHIITAVPAPACITWADRVVTITSLMGFEALMRGKAVTTVGRPFYAGWGLTDDQADIARDRALSLDELVAAALILYPRYHDNVTGLPAPPEIVIERLIAERDAPRTLPRRARDLWRNAVSWGLNQI
ncbi:MAG: hypothetical protein AB8B60_12535 [Sulfitobacter sp.]